MLMMGGAGFSHIPAMQKAGVAWAFTNDGKVNSIGNRAQDSTSGIGLQYLMAEKRMRLILYILI